MVGVGGVVIDQGRALLIRRGGEPLRGQWSIPGGTLETGETLEEGTRRELEEETGLRVRVVELIEVFERIFRDEDRLPGADAASVAKTAAARRGQVAGRKRKRADGRPRYHFVIHDYLCEPISGEARPGGDVTDGAWASESELESYHLTPTATRILKKAFAMARAAERGGS